MRDFVECFCEVEQDDVNLSFEKYLAMSWMVTISCVSDEHFSGSHADCHLVYCVGQSGS